MLSSFGGKDMSKSKLIGSFGFGGAACAWPGKTSAACSVGNIASDTRFSASDASAWRSLKIDPGFLIFKIFFKILRYFCGSCSLATVLNWLIKLFALSSVTSKQP